VHPKKEIGRIRGSDEWRLEIMCLLYILECDFDEVEEAMLQGVERPCELIFCILCIQRKDMDVVAEVMF
jgi:hypothetical protein